MRNRKEELNMKQERLSYWEMFGTSPREFDSELLIPFNEEPNFYGGDY